jgi:hypothetical protein
LSGWIKFEKDMANDPRLIELAVQMADAASLASGNRKRSPSTVTRYAAHL